jgi:adenylylsulfate kinase
MKIRNNSVIWITGLSGAGKSSLATEVVRRIRAQSQMVIMLDGDELRDVFGAGKRSSGNYCREQRLALAMQYAHLCGVISKQDVVVVIATISLFKEVHAWNRKNLPGYFEVYLKVPMDELKRRDPKNIYSRFDDGEITNVAGLDIAIDEPELADWTVKFNSDRTVDVLADELFENLYMKKEVR